MIKQFWILTVIACGFGQDLLPATTSINPDQTEIAAVDSVIEKEQESFYGGTPDHRYSLLFLLQTLLNDSRELGAKVVLSDKIKYLEDQSESGPLPLLNQHKALEAYKNIGLTDDALMRLRVIRVSNQPGATHQYAAVAVATPIIDQQKEHFELDRATKEALMHLLDTVISNDVTNVSPSDVLEKMFLTLRGNGNQEGMSPEDRRQAIKIGLAYERLRGSNLVEDYQLPQSEIKTFCSRLLDQDLLPRSKPHQYDEKIRPWYNQFITSQAARNAMAITPQHPAPFTETTEPSFPDESLDQRTANILGADERKDGEHPLIQGDGQPSDPVISPGNDNKTTAAIEAEKTYERFIAGPKGRNAYKKNNAIFVAALPALVSAGLIATIARAAHKKAKIEKRIRELNTLLIKSPQAEEELLTLKNSLFQLTQRQKSLAGGLAGSVVMTLLWKVISSQLATGDN